MKMQIYNREIQMYEISNITNPKILTLFEWKKRSPERGGFKKNLK